MDEVVATSSSDRRDGQPMVAEKIRRADARHALLVGYATATASLAVSVLWTIGIAAFGGGTFWIAGDDGGDMMLALAAFVVIGGALATGLAFVSFRRTRGVRFDGRLLSVALWTSLTPSAWALVSMLWFAVSGDVAGVLFFGWAAAVVGTAGWCMALGPLWAVLVSRGYLRRHPATRVDGGPAVHGRAEEEEDAEIDLPISHKVA